MQEEINIRTRRLSFRDCKTGDLEDYCFLKCKKIVKGERAQEIAKQQEKLESELTETNGNISLISVLDECQRVIGLIKMHYLDSETSVFIDISVPDEIKMYSYGSEALHQFVKAMREKFEKIELNPTNSIVERYIQERGVTPPVILQQQ